MAQSKKDPSFSRQDKSSPREMRPWFYRNHDVRTPFIFSANNYGVIFPLFR
jgi:hypothetical protein